MPLVGDHATPGAAVLQRLADSYDLGAGIGRHTIPLPLLQTRPADLDRFEFDTPADLILAFSAIEHLPDLKAVRRLLDRVRDATKPRGVVAIGVVADRVEVDDHGRRQPALLESAMSAAEATGLLTGAFSDFDVTYQRLGPSQVREQRGERSYTLTSTLVTWLATRPEKPGAIEPP